MTDRLLYLQASITQGFAEYLALRIKNAIGASVWCAQRVRVEYDHTGLHITVWVPTWLWVFAGLAHLAAWCLTWSTTRREKRAARISTPVVEIRVR